MVFSFRKLALRLGILYGLMILCAFIVFRAFFINLSPYVLALGIILLIAELHNSLQFFNMLYSLWPRKYPLYEKLNKKKSAQINMFICVCGEPAEIVDRTIQAAISARDSYIKAVKPLKSPKIIVLNDGFAARKDDWREIENLCSVRNVLHVKRKITDGFKAGNINNGLKKTKTNDPFNTYDIVLDADFAVTPEFLLEITKPFAQEDIDFVQTPQRYSNEITWVAKAAAAHQMHFFEHVCSAKAYDNALFLCGTNFAIRRSALESVGGMDERFITEDYATSLNLHLAGKKGTFIKKPLAYGVAPSTLKAYFSQQKRWSKGTFDTSFVYITKILFGPLTLRQKYQYIVSSIYYFSGIRNIIFMLAPLPYLFFDTPLMKASFSEFIVYVYAPFFIYNFLVYFLLFQHPLKSWILDMISFPVYISAFIASVARKELGFVVTIKKYQKENIFSVYKTQIIVAILLLSGFSYAIYDGRVAYSVGQYMNYFWVVFNMGILFLGFYLYYKDNLLSGVDGVHSFNFNKRKIISIAEYTAFLCAFIFLLSIVVSMNPSVKALIEKGVQNVSANTYREYIQKVMTPEYGVYYGYYKPQLNSHPKDPHVTISEVESPSLAMYYQDWGSQREFNTEYMNTLASLNLIPIVTWEPWSADAAQKGDLLQTQYSPKEIINGKYDDYIRLWARKAANYKKPFFLRFAHEMNGNWYPWGIVEGNSARDYKDMWKHVHSIFKEEGATNAIWVWAPNNEDNYGSSESVLNYYPGDEFVDWVGFSGFNWGSNGLAVERSFEGLTLGIYPHISKLNKPIMVAETSTVGTDEEKIQWLKKLTEEITYFSKIKAIVFYDENFKDSNFQLSEVKNIYKFIQENITNNDFFNKQPYYTAIKK